MVSKKKEKYYHPSFRERERESENEGCVCLHQLNMRLFRSDFIKKCQHHLHHRLLWLRPMLYIIITIISILIIFILFIINMLWTVRIISSILQHPPIRLPMIYFSNKQISNQAIPIYSAIQKVFLHLHRVPIQMLPLLGQLSCNIIHINNILSR